MSQGTIDVGGVCNFLGSVSSQQKYQVMDQHYSSQTVSQLSDRPGSQLSDGPVLQLRVTAPFYLEIKGKYILQAGGNVNPKDMKRGPFGSSLYFFLPPLGLP